MILAGSKLSQQNTWHTTMASLSALANKLWHNNENIFRQLHRDCNIQTYWFFRNYATKIALGIVVLYFNVFMKCFVASYFVFAD